MVAMLKEPSNKVRDIHDKLYNGNGIWFPYLNYRHFQNKLNSNDTDAVFTFQSNISSARHAITVLVRNIDDDANTAGTQGVQSQSDFQKSQLNYFRYQSGSLQWPDYGNAQVGGATSFVSGEAWALLLQAFNIKENTVHCSSISAQEWQSINSKRFIIAVDLSKDDTLWTGASLKNNFLELSLNKVAVAQAYNVHTYLGYDCALVISRSAGCRIFD
jgi:hypothetical protein